MITLTSTIGICTLCYSVSLKMSVRMTAICMVALYGRDVRSRGMVKVYGQGVWSYVRTDHQACRGQ